MSSELHGYKASTSLTVLSLWPLHEAATQLPRKTSWDITAKEPAVCLQSNKASEWPGRGSQGMKDRTENSEITARPWLSGQPMMESHRYFLGFS